MAKVNWTREAEGWLKDIFDYVATDSPDAAVRVVTGIYLKAQVLSEFPQIGHRYESVADREVRILLYGHYRIGYVVKPGGDVDILGVFHGALDIQRYLL